MKLQRPGGWHLNWKILLDASKVVKEVVILQSQKKGKKQNKRKTDNAKYVFFWISQNGR